LKVRADEHVSHEIIRAVRAMALSHTWELSSVIEVGDRSSEDVHWITKFASQGGHAIISGDRDFLNRPHQVLAVNRTGMRVIHLPAKWAGARCDLQAAFVLLWWRRIERTISAMGKRECYRPPWNATEDGELAKIKVDYQDADKWEKRQAKRDAQAAKQQDQPSSGRS